MDVELWEARCCTRWPVMAHSRWGRCGKCGTRPDYVGPWVEDEPRWKEEGDAQPQLRAGPQA